MAKHAKNRGFNLPPGCKDLFDVLRLATAENHSPECSPFLRISLPEKVAVRYLAEVSGQELDRVLHDMGKLSIYIDVNRSMDFHDAARLLDRYGIGADPSC
jgi:hypothetical protein